MMLSAPPKETEPEIPVGIEIFFPPMTDPGRTTGAGASLAAVTNENSVASSTVIQQKTSFLDNPFFYFGAVGFIIIAALLFGRK